MANICGNNASYTPAPECVYPEGTLEITENGEFDVTEFESASVNVSGGGGGDVTLVAEKNVAVTTSSDVATEFDEIIVSKAELDNKVLFIDIQDTNGVRSGYFYGWQAGKIIKESVIGVGGNYFKGGNNVLSATGFGSASNGAYGVFASITSNASDPDVFHIKIMGRYDSSRTTTIDGLFKVRIIAISALFAS